MNIQPYLFFEGRCEEALEFYRMTFGARYNIVMRYKDSPGPPPPGKAPPGEKVLHATLRVGETELLVSDGHCQGPPSFNGFSLAVNSPDQNEAQRLFAALADGGQVRMPLAKTFFSPCFGMVADRFGILWMILVNPS